MEKKALFVFRGDIPCFIHVMLNAIDMREKGMEVKVILEGESSKVLAELSRGSHPMHALFEKTKSLGLFAGVCKACAHSMGTLDSVAIEGLPLLEDMHGHAAMAPYLQKGFQVITF
jgi:hypothetical protein